MLIFLKKAIAQKIFDEIWKRPQVLFMFTKWKETHPKMEDRKKSLKDSIQKR